MSTCCRDGVNISTEPSDAVLMLTSRSNHRVFTRCSDNITISIDEIPTYCSDGVNISTEPPDAVLVLTFLSNHQVFTWCSTGVTISINSLPTLSPVWLCCALGVRVLCHRYPTNVVVLVYDTHLWCLNRSQTTLHQPADVSFVWVCAASLL